MSNQRHLAPVVDIDAVLAQARVSNPAIHTIIRTHSDDEAALLEADEGVGLVMMGEREVALGMAEYALERLGVAPEAALATVGALRHQRLDTA